MATAVIIILAVLGVALGGGGIVLLKSDADGGIRTFGRIACAAGVLFIAMLIYELVV